jgi:hypothetical protein
MTKRYPFGGAFGGGDSGDSGYFQRAAFGIFQAADGLDYLGHHFDEAVGYRGAGGYLFGGYVDHAYFAFFAVVGEFRHGFALVPENRGN